MGLTLAGDDRLKQSLVIEDRPGAGSILGTEAVARSAPDGYTLLLMSNTHTTNESLIPNKPFVLMRDFTAVAPTKPLPVITTDVPPALGPTSGTTDLTAGGRVLGPW